MILQIDVLFCIFDKLLELVDYVHFAAICKELRFVAKEYNHTKQRWWWSKRRWLLPMLMLPPTESLGIDNDSSNERQTKKRLLFSVSERRIYNNINLRLSVPYNEKFCGSSHGWLASAHKSIEKCQQKLKVQVIHEITLRNPFGKASEAIHLPPICIAPMKVTTILLKNGSRKLSCLPTPLCIRIIIMCS